MKDFVQKAFSGLASKIGIVSLMAICFALISASVNAQTLLINYDFASTTASVNSTTPCTTGGPLTTAPGVTSTFTVGGTGVCSTPTGVAATAPPAFVANSANQSVSITGTGPSPATNFFQFRLDGVSSFNDFNVFFQAGRSGTGAQSATLQYSTDGTNFTDFQTVVVPQTGNPLVLGEFNFNLSSVTAIENQPTVFFRIVGSGGTGAAGTFRIDNFQVQATAATVANPTVTLAVTPATLSETGQPAFTATVTASAPVSGDQTVNFALTSGTAGTADFISIPATITILSGQTTGTATFNVFDDSLVEGPETATFTINSPSAGITLGATTSVTVDITDNDAAALPDLIISQSGPSTANTGSIYDYSLRVSNNGATNQSVDVNFTLPAGVTFNVASAINGCTSIDLVGGVVQFRGCAAPANSSNIFFTINVTAPMTAQTITSPGSNAVVDPNSLIAESNETNNAATATVITTVTMAPTAAGVRLSGRVATESGRGIGRARVTLTGGSLTEPIYAVTDLDGNYSFDDIPAGETYILNVSVKGYKFEQSNIVINLNEDVTNAHFTGTSSKQRVRIPFE